MSRTLIRFTAVGGQGVLLAGSIFAAAKINAGGNGLKTSTYTSQVRGGPTVVDGHPVVVSNPENHQPANGPLLLV